MHYFQNKQKIIVGAIFVIVAGFICYYVYTKEDNKTIDLEVSEPIEEETKESYSDEKILIHVSGAVNKQGIVELKKDSRISDAIDKAGGLKEEADIENINLAYKVEDGMKIHILTKQEKKESELAVSQENAQSYITNQSGVSSNNQKVEASVNQTKVNINSATQAQLETLPGIGPSTATKILAYRKEKGKFHKIDDIKEVSGIGESKFKKIKDFICV